MYKQSRMWRNWQTRMVQVHVKAISWGFKSLHPHQKASLKDEAFLCFSKARFQKPGFLLLTNMHILYILFMNS